MPWLVQAKLSWVIAALQPGTAAGVAEASTGASSWAAAWPDCAVLQWLSSFWEKSSQMTQSALHTCGVLHATAACFNCKGKNKTLSAPAVSGKVQKQLSVSVPLSVLGIK